MTIQELLDSMITDSRDIKDMPNTKGTWARIGSRDSFSELGMSSSEKDEFLKEWTEANPYANAN